MSDGRLVPASFRATLNRTVLQRRMSESDDPSDREAIRAKKREQLRERLVGAQQEGRLRSLLEAHGA